MRGSILAKKIRNKFEYYVYHTDVEINEVNKIAKFATVSILINIKNNNLFRLPKQKTK